MKQIRLIILIFFISVSATAQNELPADSTVTINLSGIKDFDGFLIDMNIMNISQSHTSGYTLSIPDASKDYSFIFRLNPNITYSQGYSNIFGIGNSSVYSTNPFGLNGFGTSLQNLQMGSFKLNNGMRINTYGEYDRNGRKVYNPSALPWERNNFKGAFELKSANGAFGIRLEVQQGRKLPY